ncbi:mitochondrial import inner membrane translocase subunit TIM44-like [Penaeus japonicus]|uniref:mitochondrial import inner membrane translocase subunit TIM44-like n=1 Tax=Penaeus japonicus TaxID=27405 RepID=UPI001C70F725|nr:mitochondrial import inner membrane translocase subunit TIM44-like [Penaeus japonicus]
MAASISRAWKHLPFSGSSRCVKAWHPSLWNGRGSGCPALASTVGTQQLNGHPLKRFYSATPPPQRPPTFLGKIIENLRDELSRNQKMKESLKEFRKDMEKLEKSEALQKAREKYQSVEEETAEGGKRA